MLINIILKIHSSFPHKVWLIVVHYFIILGSKSAILKYNNAVPAIAFPPQEENHTKSCSPEKTATEGWQIRALEGTETQLQAFCLSKGFYLWLFPTFRVLLNSVGKLAWGRSAPVWGSAFRSYAVWAIKCLTKKKTILLSISIPWLMTVLFISAQSVCKSSQSQILALIQIPGKTLHISHDTVKSVLWSIFSLLCIKHPCYPQHYPLLFGFLIDFTY